MYFITGMTNVLTMSSDFRSFESKNHITRCFGYYLTESEARNAVETNCCDINEGGMFPYVLIEKIGDGVHSRSEEIGWYKYVRKTDRYIEYVQEPTGSCNYAIG